MRRVYLVIFLPLLLLAVGVGLVWFLLVYRSKDSLRYLVDKESKGRYVFDARSVHVSFRHHSIQLEDAVLYCRDTLNTDAWYNVRIPKIYLSITSWKTLLLQKKLIVDSLSIYRPDIDLHVYKTLPRKTHADFRASDILDYLDKALVHFNVHAFSLQGASFTYRDPNHLQPLHGDNINLSVSNFTGVNNVDSHLLGSDKVALFMGPQHWTFAGGKNEIDFASLRFNSRGQRFELDSFTFRQHSDTSRDIVLTADQFFFNSRHLPAIYQKEELLLDTVTVVNPVLSLPAYNGQKPPKDTLGQLRYKNSLFKHINVRFIDVIDGALAFQGKQQSSASTQKVNLSVFNLDINPLHDPTLVTDSVRIKLDSISFLTKDGLYKLSIGHFTIHGEDAVFRDVVYAPTLPGRSDKDVRFQAPALVLRHISLGDLLQRHIRASGAELEEPSISMEDRGGVALGAAAMGSAPAAAASAPRSPGGSPTAAALSDRGPGGALKGASAPRSPAGGGAPHGPAGASAPLAPPSDAKLALFYKTLHNVSELIDVADFRITRGSAHYRSAGRMEGNVTGLSTHILLNQFFISDSLVDIKHAIPEWQIGDMNLSSATFSVTVHGYRFDGLRQLSTGDHARFTTTSGLDIQANNIRWKVLDWDAYQRTRAIRFDSLHIETLIVRDSSASGARGQAPGAAPAGAPGAPRALPDLHVGRLRIDRIVVRKPSGRTPIYTTIQPIDLSGLRSEGRFLAWDHARLRFTGLSAGSLVHVGAGSFDADEGIVLSGLRLQTPALLASLPDIHLDMRCHSTDFSHLSASVLRFEQGTLRYTYTGLKDTLRVQAAVGGQMTDVHLAEGVVTASIHLLWDNGTLAYHQGHQLVTAESLSGIFHHDTMHLYKGMPLRWQTLLSDVTLQDGSVVYTSPQIRASAAHLSWAAADRRLSLDVFSLLPRLSQAETFAKARWQGDYVTVRGQAVTLNGIRFPEPGGDSTYRVRSIVVSGATVSAVRDKNIPFRHGIEKPMPTRLLEKLKVPLSVDTVLLQHDSVTYHERSASTGQWSTIPIDDIHGVVTHLRSGGGRGDSGGARGDFGGARGDGGGRRDSGGDTLRLEASGSLLGGRIHHFSYREAYGDSLSFFTASVTSGPMDLTRFSVVSVPAAAVQINGGRVDTVFAWWRGNKYAAYGTMHFYYKGLTVSLLNKRGWRRRAVSLLINLLLPGTNTSPAPIYIERDREKFVFNYWVKTQTSGLLATVGLKKGRKYRDAVKTATGSGKHT
ncbi:hypothetical protein [Dinghuibacter silviterrae]|uniref:Uncharacterized protein n=1 Tax=Dinghuibacter silviterrae TaxID=1539049 RepID=A0A4R8DRN6_9BACT|nr:hypothetical protein [Dinghuibacter silviterrae]TDX00874.1 hypothetical protein EDB95_1903 [Dinghuibacter silviterrae]